MYLNLECYYKKIPIENFIEVLFEEVNDKPVITDSEMHRKGLLKVNNGHNIPLQIDSAGGHGVKQKEFENVTAGLLAKGIEVMRQPTFSPETNLLNLGFWRMLKTRISQQHLGITVDATTSISTRENEI